MIKIDLGNNLPTNLHIGDIFVIGTDLYQVIDFRSEPDGPQSKNSTKDNLSKWAMNIKKIFSSDDDF